MLRSFIWLVVLGFASLAVLFFWPTTHANEGARTSEPLEFDGLAIEEGNATEEGSAIVRGRDVKRSEDSEETVDDGLLHVRLRCVAGDGTPLEGIHVKWSTIFRGDESNELTIRGVTDAYGLVNLSRPRTRNAFAHDVVVEDERYPTVGRRWKEDGETFQDLGMLTVEAAATLRGRLLDFRGDPILESWEIHVTRTWDRRKEDQAIWYGRSLAAPSDHPREWFEFGRLPAGNYVVSANYPHFEIASTSVELEPGKTTTIELRQQRERDPRHDLLVTTHVPPLTSHPQREQVHLVLADGTERIPDLPPRFRVGTRLESEWDWQRDPRFEGHLFNDLEPGDYTLRVDDPRFATWQAIVPTGPRAVIVELRGDATIQLQVVDGAGQPIERYDITSGESGSPRGFVRRDMTLPRERMHPGGLHLFQDLPVGDYVFGVRTEDCGERTVRVDALTHGERRTVRVVMEPPITLTGRVTFEHDHTPVRRAYVSLVEPARSGDASTSALTLEGRREKERAGDRHERHRVQTEDDGTFVIEDVRPGRWIPVVSLDTNSGNVFHPLSPMALVSMAPVRVLSAADTHWDLTLPAPTRMRLTFSWPAGEEYVSIELERADVSANRTGKNVVGFRAMAGQGEMNISPLDPGTYRVFLLRGPATIGQLAAPSRARFACADVTIPSGGVGEYHVDIGEHRTASLLVRLKFSAARPRGVMIQLEPVGDSQSFQALVDEKGEVNFATIAPGNFDVIASGTTTRWSIALGRATTGEGESTVLESSIAIHEGRVQLREIGGDPISRALFRMKRVGTDTWKPGVADSSGFVTWELPQGTYKLFVWEHSEGQFRRSPFVSFSWPTTEEHILWIEPPR
ncbi:MAG: hypothetical protein H6834_18170 [Planctomycetes bacterium]|nr:hypothetical protein [Planctomycetota bacterium]